jgi:hypothetical protein
VNSFTGLLVRDLFCHIHHDSSKVWGKSRLSPDKIIKLHEELKQSLIGMHKPMSLNKNKIRSGTLIDMHKSMSLNKNKIRSGTLIDMHKSMSLNKNQIRSGKESKEIRNSPIGQT